MKRKPIPDPLVEQVEAELLEGEELLWVGQPGAGAVWQSASRLAARALVVGFFAAIAIAFWSIWSSSAVVTGANIVWPILMMIVIVLVLAGVMVVRGMRESRDTVYAITDRRAIIFNNKGAVRSFGAQDIEFIERQMRGVDRGDIIFKRESRPRVDYYGDGAYGSHLYETPVGFLGIDNPREVEALMLRTFRPRDYDLYVEKPKLVAREAEGDEVIDAPESDAAQNDAAQRLRRR
ncbi:MAG: hypothetical protein HXY40_04035 [Chloroflexi bacterium]|nr:hypothetical protein [Chloroflexota bacterium]